MLSCSKINILPIFFPILFFFMRYHRCRICLVCLGTMLPATVLFSAFVIGFSFYKILFGSSLGAKMVGESVRCYFWTAAYGHPYAVQYRKECIRICGSRTDIGAQFYRTPHTTHGIAVCGYSLLVLCLMCNGWNCIRIYRAVVKEHAEKQCQ